MSVAPTIPTMSESALPGFEEYIWYVVAVPAATPVPIVNVLNAGIVSALKSPEVAAALSGDGAEIVGSSAQQCTAFTASEISKYARVIEKAGITPTD
jgi:tripartite-type tricarboxylate transporter receptor subunit TctC